MSVLHKCTVFLGLAIMADRLGLTPEWPTVAVLADHKDCKQQASHSARRDWTALEVLEGISVAMK